MPRRVYPNLAAYLRDHPDESAYMLAKEVGCSPAFFSMIKWGVRQPALELALRMASRFQIPLESLIRRHRKAS